MNKITIISSAYSIPGSYSLTGSDIIDIIEDYFGMKKDEIKLKTRIAEIRKPRQIAIWMLANRNISNSEYQSPEWSKIIHQYFPLFDNATMIHSFRVIENEISSDKIFRHRIHEIQDIIYQREKKVVQNLKEENRKLIYDKYRGNCAYCGNPIEFDNFQIDHKLAKFRGGTDDIKNLLPTCKICNHYKRALPLETFRNEWLGKLHTRYIPKKPRTKNGEKRKQYMNNILTAYGITKHKPFSGIFYFEKIENTFKK